MKKKLKEKENKMSRNGEMHLSEMEFSSDYCDGSTDLELVNEFFETNDEPTTAGREYKGCAGGYPVRMPPYTFRLKEKVYEDNYGGAEWSNGFYDDNQLLGWPTDCRRTNYESGWTPRGSDEIN
jgi:hypothetical protein